MKMTLQEAREQQKAKIRHRIFLRCRELRIISVLKNGISISHIKSRAMHEAYLENTKNNNNIVQLLNNRSIPTDILRNVKEMLLLNTK